MLVAAALAFLAAGSTMSGCSSKGEPPPLTARSLMPTEAEASDALGMAMLIDDVREGPGWTVLDGPSLEYLFATASEEHYSLVSSYGVVMRNSGEVKSGARNGSFPPQSIALSVAILTFERQQGAIAVWDSILGPSDSIDAEPFFQPRLGDRSNGISGPGASSVVVVAGPVLLTVAAWADGNPEDPIYDGSREAVVAVAELVLNRPALSQAMTVVAALPTATSSPVTAVSGPREIGEIAAFSSDRRDVTVTVTLDLSVSAMDMRELIRNVGPNWFERLVETRVRNFFQEEIRKFEQADIMSSLDLIRERVRERLSSDLAPFSIVIGDVLVDGIDLGDGQ